MSDGSPEGRAVRNERDLEKLGHLMRGTDSLGESAMDGLFFMPSRPGSGPIDHDMTSMYGRAKLELDLIKWVSSLPTIAPDVPAEDPIAMVVHTECGPLVIERVVMNGEGQLVTREKEEEPDVELSPGPSSKIRMVYELCRLLLRRLLRRCLHKNLRSNPTDRTIDLLNS